MLFIPLYFILFIFIFYVLMILVHSNLIVFTVLGNEHYMQSLKSNIITHNSIMRINSQ